MEEKETITPETEAQTAVTGLAGLSATNSVIIGLVVVIVIMAGFLFNSNKQPASVTPVAASEMSMPAPATSPDTMPETTTPAPSPMIDTPAPASMAATHGGIERNGEGRLFYTSIKIPAGAETLYVSGSGASMKADGTWGNMEEQAIDTFNKFKATLEGEGWSMSDIVQVRAFAVAGDYGLLDFDGFNRGSSRFFGTQENPNKPVRSFVQVADLVVDGWLVEIEIRAARMPD